MNTTIPEAPTTTEVAEALTAAADLFTVRAWGQGDAVPQTLRSVRAASPICAALAIGLVAAPHVCGLAQLAVEHHLDVDNLVRRNDEDGRTKAEVVTALREAAVSARAAA